MAGRTLIRYDQVRVADLQDDQHTASEIVLAPTTPITQEDLQELVLSQIKRIIFGNSPGNWYLDFEALGIQDLKTLSSSVGFNEDKIVTHQYVGQTIRHEEACVVIARSTGNVVRSR
jgi:hypothetical protein